MKHAPTSRFLPFVALTAAAVVATVGLTACSSTPVKTASSSTVAPPSSTAGPAPSAAGPGSASPSASTTPSKPTPSKPAQPAKPTSMRMGSTGASVLALQQRLTALGYWLGTPSGHFDGSTEQAVYALQKAAGIAPSGTVTKATAAALTTGVRPTATSKHGRVIEVNLSKDLLLFVTDGKVKYILNTSTGGGYTYTDQGTSQVAITPKGHFHTYRVIDALHRSSLGLLIRPRYFIDGVAIHGDGYVPARPVSHGCVRVTSAAINWIWSANLDPVGTRVWVY